jgi:signal transduction histidine kinase
MIQAHGGRLGLDSAVGGGTAATLRFPPERTLERHIAA